ncbi:MAG: hypothetical protein OS130_15605 [Thermodesulfobacteriota bacterium]|nr:MAG: hypothetical protein OS130_15605 [Thermodesulfobacteriota bacterium]
MTGHNQEDHRPWGYFLVLSDQPDHKVKRIVGLSWPPSQSSAPYKKEGALVYH